MTYQKTLNTVDNALDDAENDGAESIISLGTTNGNKRTDHVHKCHEQSAKANTAKTGGHCTLGTTACWAFDRVTQEIH